MHAQTINPALNKPTHYYFDVEQRCAAQRMQAITHQWCTLQKAVNSLPGTAAVAQKAQQFFHLLEWFNPQLLQGMSEDTEA